MRALSELGLVGQGARFAMAGGAVATLYLALTTILADGLGVPFQLALVVGTCAALIAHFALQRAFVWVHTAGFALRAHQQAGRYLVVAGVQYGLTVASTASLPGLLGLPITYVYFGTAVLIAGLNFVVFRVMVFYPKIGAHDGPDVSR